MSESVTKVFCWVPTYCQGTLCWLRFVWQVTNENRVQYFPYDPRDAKAQAEWLRENG